jgi:hypothetical protein
LKGAASSRAIFLKRVSAFALEETLLGLYGKRLRTTDTLARLTADG